MGGYRTYSARISKGVGWRLNRLGSRLQARAAAEGDGEGRIESFDASVLVRNGWKAPDVDVLFYFPDTVSKIYQIQQWLPVIAAHETDLRYGIVTRAKSSWMELMRDPNLPAPNFLATTFVSLMDLYRVLDPKVIIYPNNGLRNFQSLIWADAAHVHVNHGESDKVSMVSNQAKAYDRVFVAGEAAVRRHRAALVGFDERHLVRVGRPQLDLNPKPSIPKATGPTVLYAPTWEGEDEMNNFTSLDLYGPQIVAATLGLPGVRLVYKPHPRVVNSPNSKVASAHRKVVEMIESANETDPGRGHLYLDGGDILAVFPRVDLLISDVSSVTLDFLYSRPQVPIVLTDRRSDPAGLLREAPIADGAHVIDASTVGDVAHDLAAALNNDQFAAKRAELRKFYFDDVAPGDSTRRFYEALDETIRNQQAGLATTRALRAQGTWANWTGEAVSGAAVSGEVAAAAVTPEEAGQELVAAAIAGDDLSAGAVPAGRIAADGAAADLSEAEIATEELAAEGMPADEAAGS